MSSSGALVELAIAMGDAGDVDGGIALLQEALDCATSSLGANRPESLAAKGDMAAVLFELGPEEEASSLEREAFEGARTYFGEDSFGNLCSGLESGAELRTAWRNGFREKDLRR